MANSPGKAVTDSGNPATYAIAVTPGDVDGFDLPTRGIYVGVSGDVSVQMANESGTTDEVVFVAVPVGILPIRCMRVNDTNTTATDIVALW
jgi:hypothetical protein